MKKKIFLTGATGFVGRHLALNLMANGYDVISLVRDVRKAKTIPQLRGANFFLLDISKTYQLPSFPPDSILIHCAWEDVRNTTSIKHIEEYFPQHLRFIKKVIEQGVKKILVTGTCYEYGLRYGPVSASTIPMPNTPYACAKDSFHKALRNLQLDFDFQLLWARLFFMYGDGQAEESIVSLLDAALERGDKEFKMSHGEQLLDYMPVECVADKIRILLNYDDGAYNVCSGKPISVRRLIERRMVEKKRFIALNLGFYEYRKHESLALWGADPIS